MRGINKVSLLGNFVRDPETILIEGEDETVCHVKFATTDQTIKKGKKIKQSDFHSLILVGGLAELALKYMRKGSQAFFIGKNKIIHERNVVYIDRTGEMIMLGGKPKPK
jgi:single-strand DNA-binding protein